MMKHLLFVVGAAWLTACNSDSNLPVTPSGSDLQFTELAATWDEGMPLGNATVGALVWQRDSALRLSLDRTDLWDLRPMDSISGPNNRFAWVCEQVKKNNYLPVQQKYDHPYEQQPAPSKIPGAALEFSLTELGTPSDVHLYLSNALCQATWDNGATLQTFVHATEPVGWFVFNNLPASVTPALIAPKYNNPGEAPADHNSVDGQDLRRLGYKQGTIQEQADQISYHQEGKDGFSYDIHVRWEQKGKTLRGVWSVTSSLTKDQAADETLQAMSRGIGQDYQAHMDFWKNFHAQSSVTLPDSILQKQYDNEMYKFGSATREDSYPISLQAVWTADNGKLPPWKGDYHHDLNTQLSYWPAYTGNHLTEGLGYLNTLWNQQDVYKKYTRQYFETDGMNIPGVCTLLGEPMGGWIQYSMSQTVGAWLAQHFYLHWKYSADRTFLADKAYPFLRETATFLEQVSVVNDKGVRTLVMSSSPEIFDNSINAWFKDITNYDLSLMRFAFGAASELATELNLSDEAAHWKALNDQLPPFDLDQEGALTFAKGFPYEQSHRHFSHAMAIHPLGLVDWSQGEASQRIIRATLKKLEDYTPDYWTGYSYSWFGNMKARAFDGEGAAQALRTFAECFCLRNTFHMRSIHMDYYNQLNNINNDNTRYVPAYEQYTHDREFEPLIRNYFEQYLGQFPAQVFDKMNENFVRCSFYELCSRYLSWAYTFALEQNNPAGRSDFEMTGIPGTEYYKDDRVVEFKYFKAPEAKRVLARTEPYPADTAQVKEYARAILAKFPYYNVRTYVVYIVANKGYRFWEV